MLFLYRFFCGILEVEFFGVYPEKVLNLAAKNRILLWSARYKKQRICCKITVKDFLKLPAILRKSGIRVHIVEKRGFPFFMKKYNKRLGIFLGLIVFFLSLQIMSSYVWIIEVEGNKTVSESEILSVCEDLGISVGVKKKNFSAKQSAQQLLLKMDKLAWGSFNLEGCKLTINVTEITEKKEDNAVATNLVATADGTISHINVTAGNCLVKVGDVVTKGDVLVSGVIENESGTRFVHSIGEIEAITETTVELEQNLSFKVSVPTGETKVKRVLDIFSLKIPLYLGGEKGDFESEKDVWQWELFSQKLPIKIHTKKFVFTKSQTKKISITEAKKMLEKRLKNEYKGQIKSKTYKESENCVSLSAVIVDKKNIVRSEKMIFGIGKE